ncbi:MAG: FtsW/RodA/SpoVE family cell cycle protein [Dehalococcoidia bacterium]|nr:FtsW/RodA/SpoVE family cell cycle protein [Dehalococcoidia bacterium]
MIKGRGLVQLVLAVQAGLLAVAGFTLLSLVQAGSWTVGDLAPGLIFSGLVIVAHLALVLAGYGAGESLFPVSGLLAGLGLVMAYRLGGNELGNRQLLSIALGVGSALAICLALRDVTQLRRYKYTWAVLGVFLVALTFLLGHDPNQSGARLWLGIGSLQFQPSEFLKVMLVIFFAGYLEENREIMARGRLQIGPFKVPPLAHLLPLSIMWLLSMLVLVVQRDFGAAILFFGVFLAMLYVATARFSYLLAGAVAFLAGAFLAYRSIAIVQVRAEAWLDPWSIAAGRGYQTIQGLMSLASGGILGSGLGQGRPDFVPAAFTDLMLAAVGEEFGLLGAVAIVMLFLVLVHRGYHIAISAGRPFDRLLATGLTTVLGLQTLTIMGGTLRVLPLTGIPLPFLSYGGSSMLTNFVIIGLLLKIAGGRGTHV